jgi:hypothetical protein
MCMFLYVRNFPKYFLKLQTQNQSRKVGAPIMAPPSPPSLHELRQPIESGSLSFLSMKCI